MSTKNNALLDDGTGSCAAADDQARIAAMASRIQDLEEAISEHIERVKAGELTSSRSLHRFMHLLDMA